MNGLAKRYPNKKILRKYLISLIDCFDMRIIFRKRSTGAVARVKGDFFFIFNTFCKQILNLTLFKFFFPKLALLAALLPWRGKTPVPRHAWWRGERMT